MDTAIDLQRDWLQAYWLSAVDLGLKRKCSFLLFREGQMSICQFFVRKKSIFVTKLPFFIEVFELC